MWAKDLPALFVNPRPTSWGIAQLAASMSVFVEYAGVLGRWELIERPGTGGAARRGSYSCSRSSTIVGL